MLKFLWKHFPSCYSIAAIALTIASWMPHVGRSEELAAVPNGPYRIGLMCVEIPDIVRPHLAIPQDQGMIVEEIVEGSPAQKAGIQRRDVLVSVDDKPMHGITELVQAVQASGGNPIRLKLIRGGNEVSVQVTPVSDTQGDATQGGPDAFHRLRDVLKYQPAKRGELFLRRGPIFFFGNAPLPPNVDVHIHSNADAKVEMLIKRDGQEWKLTSPDAVAQLEQIPEDIRPTINQLAHGLGVIEVSPDVKPIDGPMQAKAFEDAARAFRKAIPQIVDHRFDVHWADPNDLPPEGISQMTDQLMQLEKQLAEQSERLRQLEKRLPNSAPPQALPVPATPPTPEPVEPTPPSGGSNL